MTRDEKPGSGAVRFREYGLGGIAGGAGAGVLAAYLELLFLLLTVGTFWVDLPLVIKALALYGLVGAAGGAACSGVLYFIFFRRHPLRHIRPWAFFLASLSAAGLLLEIVVFLLDIHTFRNFTGGWTFVAFGVLFMGLLAAGLAGWAIAGISRRFFQGESRRSLWNGGIVLMVCLALFLLAWGFSAFQDKGEVVRAPLQKGEHPANIIILLVDALRADHLSAYGYPLPTSPAIDRLAREGVLFRNCYATSTWTIPTHASIFTGLLPSAHGAYSLYSPMDPVVPTLATLLAGKGYRTGAFYDNPLLGSRYGLLRGFQKALGVDNAHKVSLTLPRVRERLLGARSMSRSILLAAGKWIEQSRGRKSPFFLFVNLLDAHLPYHPQEPYIHDFLKSLPHEKVNLELTRQFVSDGILAKKKADMLFARLTAADWRWLERFYDSNIRVIDDQIGLFLRRLKSGGMLANTLVVITADHGELFGENGLGGHNQVSMPRPALHIPLIFWFPKRLPPGEIRQPVSQLDILPNVMKLAGLAGAIPRQVQGADLFTLSREREILAEFWDEIRMRFNRTLVYGDFKLLVRASGKRELYDLKNDPREKNDLAALRPELLQSLLSRLDARLRSMPQKKSVADAQKKKDMEKSLKSLGYL